MTTHWLDWAALEGRDTEDRLAQLCRWIIDAHAEGHAFGLRIPGTERAPAVGRRHRHRCLTALADFQPLARADG